MREQDTNVPLARIEALDVHQGPLQRAFGVFAVDVQTGAGGKGGEISLPALTPEAVQALREARPHAAIAETAPAGPRRKLSAGALTAAAVTAGQLWILLPILAGAAQFSSQLFDRESGEEALSLLPDTWTAVLLVAAALLAAAWLLSALGAVVAFAGFTITRDGDRLRIRRGLVQRREATVPVGRVRAVRVVEGVLRRPFGLASLTVEVTGYAEEQAAARTLFPLVRVRDVPAFLAELLPELADEPRGLERPPRRAARRYVLPGAVAGALVTAAAWILVGYFGLVAPLAGALYGYAQWRSAGLAPERRPPRGPRAADRPYDGARAGRAARVAHGRADRAPAPRPARRPRGRVRQGHDRPHPPPRGRGRPGYLVGALIVSFSIRCGRSSPSAISGVPSAPSRQRGTSSTPIAYIVSSPSESILKRRKFL